MHTPQPAKSTTPTLSHAARLPVAFQALSQPVPLQTQCTTTGYTKPVRKALYAAYAAMEHRSATAPLTIVAAVAAKANWKNQLW